MIAAIVYGAVPILSQTVSPKPSFEVVSIKPSPPNLGMRGGGPRGDRFILSGASLRMLLQNAYQPPNQAGPIGQVQIIGGPSWIDSDRYEIQAKADCSGGAVSRDQFQLMVQSMLEERFQLKAHMEARELPIYNLVADKDGPRIQASADQTPPAFPAAVPPQLCGPVSALPGPPVPPPPPPPPGQRGGLIDFRPLPRGAMVMGLSPAGMTMQASSVPFSNLVGLLTQTLGRPVVDKTGLKGLFDFRLQFSPEGISLPEAPGGFGRGLAGPAGPGEQPAVAADPLPSIFTVIQDLGLRLESSRGPVDVLVIDSVEKPTEN
jgi:uncharacterized protein (TIGR03435 family)